MPKKSEGKTVGKGFLNTEKIKINPRITALAKSIIDRQESGSDPYRILLGAGASIQSGNPSGEKLEESLLESLGLKKIPELFKLLEGATRTSSTYYAVLKKQFRNARPSIGYYYLTYLLAQKYFGMVFTTNWDNLLESTLARYLDYSDFKVIIKGEVDNNKFCKMLKSETPRVKVVKIHGDLESKEYDVTDNDLFEITNDSMTMSSLREYLSRDIIIIGHKMNDSDIQQALYNGDISKGGVIWFVSPNGPRPKSFIEKTIAARGCERYLINAGFDEFFIQLAMEIARYKMGNDSNWNDDFMKVLDGYERGANYYSNRNVRTLVRRLCADIDDDDFKPDLIVYVHDPEAPGGTEVRKWIEKIDELKDINAQVIEIMGRNEKVKQRSAKLLKPDAVVDRYKIKKILLVDSITFSGNTSKLAVDLLKKEYGKKDIRLGFLSVGRTFLNNLKNGIIEGITEKDIYKGEELDRMEVFFPWG
ncbi:MAG: SIR2 family protein, partial [Candidatus Zixiibacteriota bacterium]